MISNMRYLLTVFFLSTSAFAQFSMNQSGPEPKIAVQNSILAKVNGTTISMMDIKKKMDLAFHQHYPQLVDSTQARFQFYQTSWRRVLSEMIDNELILADAADKEVKLTDGEVREEIENRFGPNVMTTLDQIGITYDEAWKLLKNEMLVQRMSWWFIQAKALAKVTPGEIRQGYRLYLKDHPAYTEWTYRVLTIRGDDAPQIAEELYPVVKDKKIDNLPDFLKEFESTHTDCNLSLSNEYKSADTELAESHRTALAALDPGTYSAPTLQVGRDKKKVYRIFYLNDKVAHAAATFDEMAPLIKNELLQKASAELSQGYLTKLRKHYRFDADHLKETLPNDLQPFSLQ